jgi:hypothetical protein
VIARSVAACAVVQAVAARAVNAPA